MLSGKELMQAFMNEELPELRKKDFRGDDEKMAFTAYLDGYALGVSVAIRKMGEDADVEGYMAAKNGCD